MDLTASAATQNYCYVSWWKIYYTCTQNELSGRYHLIIYHIARMAEGSPYSPMP